MVNIFKGPKLYDLGLCILQHHPYLAKDEEVGLKAQNKTNMTIYPFCPYAFISCTFYYFTAKTH